MPSSEDHAKYFCALGSRSVRRVAAKVYAAADLDADTRIAMLEELAQAIEWQQRAALVGWPLKDYVDDGEDGDEGVVEINWAVYSDGRPVFTVVDWMDGYATIVHPPDSVKRDTEDNRELAVEMCPCCGGMPSTGLGADEDGALDGSEE